MARSMTGYGRDTAVFGDTTITIEIRSVNHRFIDFTAKVPHSFMFLEDKLKRIIKSYFHRGKVDIYINVEGSGLVRKKLVPDWELMDQYIKQMENVKMRYQLEGDISAAALVTNPDMMSVHEVEEQPDDLEEVIISSAKRSCEQVLNMRDEEGSYLLKDLTNIMQKIESTAEKISSRRDQVIEEYRDRIRARIDDYTGNHDIIDQARMHQEIALMAEKGDITEEITRLSSHIKHFFETVEGEGPVGRKLDFIIQEMHREANTIGSKSNDSKIGVWIVTLKSDIEKVKEQIQNIE
ncbi:YicC/YloC family endoribonuclease [Virgibacillus kekensis]|uniref:YicC/YloC family endoribonuclease n=1 Tax=Virgibacillus kekensis TaxID=202261 RepID=A0ABV9DE44_9BACI